MERFKVGIIEAACPLGAELVRIILRHPLVELAAVSSGANTGRRYSDAVPGMFGMYDEICVSAEEVIARSDIVFGTHLMHSGEEIAALCVKSRSVFIDLAPDFRLDDIELQQYWYNKPILYPGLHEAAIYSIPELTGELLPHKVLISCAGARPTAASIALAPLLAAELIEPKGVIIDAKIGYRDSQSGESGGFERADAYAYACSGHRHEPEIAQVLSSICGKRVELMYVPHVMPPVRGALVTCYAKKTLSCSSKTIRTAYERAYIDAPFVRIMPDGRPVSVSAVEGTNMCDITFTAREDSDTVIICAALDPLIKGGAGQAVQSMNLMLTVPETTGLEIK